MKKFLLIIIIGFLAVGLTSCRLFDAIAGKIEDAISDLDGGDTNPDASYMVTLDQWNEELDQNNKTVHCQYVMTDVSETSSITYEFSIKNSVYSKKIYSGAALSGEYYYAVIAGHYYEYSKNVAKGETNFTRTELSQSEYSNKIPDFDFADNFPFASFTYDAEEHLYKQTGSLPDDVTDVEIKFVDQKIAQIKIDANNMGTTKRYYYTYRYDNFTITLPDYYIEK